METHLLDRDRGRTGNSCFSRSFCCEDDETPDDRCDVKTHGTPLLCPTIAATIHTQLGPLEGPVPIHDIARALDISHIHVAKINGFVGALITQPERDIGTILVRALDSLRRQRFTIAHEPGHFLCSWHQSTDPGGFACRSEDLWLSERPSDDHHRRQEAEANNFAIELLAPINRVRPFLQGLPDLEHVVRLSNELDISRQAAVGRFVSLHSRRLAFVVSQDADCDYVVRAGGFPALRVAKGRRLPKLPSPARASGLSAVESADAAGWITTPINGLLKVQSLHQQDRYAITLLHLGGDEFGGESDGALMDFRM